MSGQIFISYRREDSLGSTGRLYDRLKQYFAQEQIFMDVDTIQPGDDFVEAIEQAVSKCDVVIAVIGKDWVQMKNQHGRRMLDNSDDFVRTEIRAALQRRIRVIPVLVENAEMPAAADLPDDIKLLTRRNAIELSHTRFNMDAERLVKSLQKALDEAEAQAQKRTEQEQREQAQREAQQKEEAAWATATSEDSVTVYQDYLTAFPTGKYVAEGQKRIAALLQEVEEKEKLQWFEEHYRQGTAALERQQFTKALSSFTEAQKIFPPNKECRERIAECEHEIEKQEKEAEQQKAEEEARLKKEQEAKWQREQERLAKEQAVEDHLQRLEHKADDLKSTGKYGAALRLYEQVLAQQPIRPHSLSEAAKCKEVLQTEKEKIVVIQPALSTGDVASLPLKPKTFKVWMIAGGAIVGLLLLVFSLTRTKNDSGADNRSYLTDSEGKSSASTDTTVSPVKATIENILQNMVVISGGSFIMGTNDSENETPAHTVQIKSFLLLKYEVTRAQWDAVMGDNRYSTAMQTPATNLSWDEVQGFINKLNVQSGKKFRLPTENEWEYVCTEGYGNDYRENLAEYSWNKDNANDTLHPVGQKVPNTLGIYDMLGNAYEWCADSYGKYKGSKNDGKKVLRGGDYKINTYFLSPKIRNWHKSTGFSETIGFRLAMDNGT